MPNTVAIQHSDCAAVNANGKLELVAPHNPNCKAKQTTPRWDLLNKDPFEPLAVDIEFQTCKAKDAPKWSHRMGRVSFVSTKGELIYDTYVRYRDEEDLAVRVNRRFGVEWKDLKIRNGAQWIDKVEEHLEKIMDGRVIVGHGMRHDISAIDSKLWKLVAKTVDTQGLYGQIALATLVEEHLTDFDFDWHDPTHDAKATMLLYLLMRPYKGRHEFEEKFTFDEESFPALGAAPAKKRS